MTTFAAEVTGEAVTLTVSDLTAAGECIIDRQPDNGIVRGTPVVLAAGGGTVLTDVEYPFGKELTYTLTVRDVSTGVTIETLQAVLPAIDLGAGNRGVMLSNPLTGQQVVVTCVDERDAESEFRGFRFNLSGRLDPLYVTEYHGEWKWTAEYLTLTESDRAQLGQLLRLGQPVLVRPSEGCDLFFGWTQPENIRLTRFSIPASDRRRRWEVEMASTGAPDSTVEPSFVTLQDLHEWEPTTLQDINDRVPTTLLNLTLAVTRDSA